MLWNRTGDHEMISESKSRSNGPWERNMRYVRKVRIPIAALVFSGLMIQPTRADLFSTDALMYAVLYEGTGGVAITCQYRM
jgi:hypothetical protein